MNTFFKKTSTRIALAFGAILLLSTALYPYGVNALTTRTQLDGGGGGGGGYYQQTDVKIPEITPPQGADVDITEAVNGNDAVSSRQYSVQINKTLWYAWNRWAGGCGSTTGCLPTSDTAMQGWVTGLADPNITIGYDISVRDAATNVPYAENDTVPVGSQIKLVFGKYVPNNIFWFGTGFSMDSPFGEWRANATPPARSGTHVTCDAKDYVVKYNLPGYGITLDIYIPFVVNPPARTIQNIPSNLSCGALTENANGTGVMTCTVNAAGPVVPQFHFDATYGKFYYRYYDYRSQYVAGCYGNNIPMTGAFANATDPTYNTNTSMQAAYQVTIPVKNINFPLVAVPSNDPPATPTLTCATSGQTGQALSFTVSATDPDADSLRYGFDWVSAGTVNEWVPATGYVVSGTSKTVSHTWNTAGTYIVKALAEDNVGGRSAWKSCAVTISAPPPVISCSASPNPAVTGQSVTASANVSGGSGNFTYAWSENGTAFGGNAATASKSFSGTGTKTITLSVTDNGPTPTANVTASPTSITSGSSSTLSWTSTNASSCTGTGFSTGGAVAGSVTVSPSVTTTYSISCPGSSSGTATDSQTITVTAAPVPTATLTGTPNSGAASSARTLTWSSTNATTCTGTNFSTLDATSGSATVNPLSTTVYTVTCTGAGGSDAASKTLTVVPAPTATISGTPLTGASGSTRTLTWSSTNATTCTGTNFSTGNATSGTKTVSPAVSTTYGVSCTGAGGTDVDGTTMTVGTTGTGGGGGCFAPETLVLMADGSSKPINQIALGDRVMGEDEQGNRAVQTVTHLFVHEGSYETLRLNGTLIVTPNHPMRSIRGGVKNWTEAGALSLGDLLVGLGGPVTLTTEEPAATLPAVYNLEVEPNHTYFAGGYLVHNKVQSVQN